MACPHTSSCELFPLFKLKTTLRVWQIRYCEGDYQSCERFKRSVCGEAMPSNLLPNGKVMELPRGGK